MASVVVALTGENANGILEAQSERFLDLLRTMGLECRLLRLREPNFAQEFDRALNDGILFAWSYAGVGARLSRGNGPIWEAASIPFISVLADAPYIMPANHSVASPFVVNGYFYREWLDLQLAHVQSSQISALLPMGVLPNPERISNPWAQRSRRMLFVKTGADPKQQRDNWEHWPARLRVVLHDSADVLAALPPGPVEPVVRDCLAAHGLALSGNKALLFGLLHELDTYVRALRATTMARALLHLPVDIVGGGWEHLGRESGRARFHPPMHASALEAVYADSQILVNTTPCLASGAHERVLRGFAAGCCVVSDDNDHSRANLSHLTAYCGVDWTARDLADRLASIFAEHRTSEDERDEARDYVETHNDPATFVTRMAELADVVRMNKVFSGYELMAA